MDPKRYAELAGLDGQEEAINREAHIEKLIRHAFDQVGLTIFYGGYPIFYEDHSREAIVTLEDQSVSLSKLKRLEATGLADNYTVATNGDSIQITFTVHPVLDAATIAN